MSRSTCRLKAISYSFLPALISNSSPGQHAANYHDSRIMTGLKCSNEIRFIEAPSPSLAGSVFKPKCDFVDEPHNWFPLVSEVLSSNEIQLWKDVMTCLKNLIFDDQVVHPGVRFSLWLKYVSLCWKERECIQQRFSGWMNDLRFVFHLNKQFWDIFNVKVMNSEENASSSNMGLRRKSKNTGNSHCFDKILHVGFNS